MDKGIYILLLKIETCSISVGSLGEILFRNGWYAYVGSALGTGGFSRVKRHLNLHKNKDKNPRWHIDYLLLSPLGSIKRVYCITTDKKIECTVATGMKGEKIMHFGSSDCSCFSHLFYYTDDPHTNLLALLQRIAKLKEIETDPIVMNPGNF